MSVTKKQYEDLLKQILNMYYQANSYFVLFDLLNKKRKDSLEKLNLSPGFFNIITMSLIDGLIITLSKILKNNTQSFSIYKFLRISKANQQIFNNFPKKDLENGIIEKIDKDTFTDFITELDKHKQIVEKLIDFRDKYTAHLDYDFLKKNKTITISEDEIEALLITLHKIICKISVAFNGSSCSKEISGTRDFEILIDKIKTT